MNKLTIENMCTTEPQRVLNYLDTVTSTLNNLNMELSALAKANEKSSLTKPLEETLGIKNPTRGEAFKKGSQYIANIYAFYFPNNATEFDGTGKPEIQTKVSEKVKFAKQRRDEIYKRHEATLSYLYK